VLASSTKLKVGRFAGAVAVALAAALTLGQVALADGDHGQTGDHLYTDDSAHVGAVCHQSNSTSSPDIYYLSSIAVVPPNAWWPDRDGDNNKEHGTVGWRITVQNDGGNSSWHDVLQTGYQKKTAYEDSQAPYSNSTKAPFTKRTVSLNGHKYSGSSYFRVKVRVNWYRKDGSLMGWSNHTVGYYTNKPENRGTLPTSGFCPNVIQFF
jgi:hypothetical protein